MPTTRSMNRDGVQDAGVDTPQENPASSPLHGSGSSHGFDEWETGLDPRYCQGISRISSPALSSKNEAGADSPDAHQLAQLGVLSKNLAVHYEEYSQFHNKIVALVPDDALEGQENKYRSFENLYYVVSNAVEELLVEAKAQPSPQIPPAMQAAPKVIIQQQPSWGTHPWF